MQQHADALSSVAASAISTCQGVHHAEWLCHTLERYLEDGHLLPVDSAQQRQQWQQQQQQQHQWQAAANRLQSQDNDGLLRQLLRPGSPSAPEVLACTTAAVLATAQVVSSALVEKLERELTK